MEHNAVYDGVVLIQVDSSVVCAYLRDHARRNAHISRIMRDFLLFCEQRDVAILPSLVASKDDKEADEVSRTISPYEFAFNPHDFRKLHRVSTRMKIDLFATAQNAQLPRFAS